MSTSIEQYMTTELVSFAPGDDILQSMRVLLEKQLSGAPVLDESETLVGILSMKDCMEIVYNTAYHQDWQISRRDILRALDELYIQSTQ